MKWLLILVFIGVLAAESYAGVFVSVRFRQHARPACGASCGVAPLAIRPILAPIQIAPIQVAPVIVQPVMVQPVIPVVTYRWGFFKRRLIPRTSYLPVVPIAQQLPAQAE